MPNWCYTSYVFHGKRDEITEFRDKIEEWTSKIFTKTDFGEKWLGNILYGVGLQDRADVGRDNPKHLRCRGRLIYLDDSEDIYGDSDDDCCFTLQTETAWCAMPRMWAETIKALGYSGMGFSYQADEPNMAEYEIYDPYGDFEEELYYFDIYLDKEDMSDIAMRIIRDNPFIDSDESVILVLQNLLNSEETDLDKLILDVENYQFKSKNSYAHIHKYGNSDPEQWV